MKLIDIACQIMAEREKAIAVADGTTHDDGKLKWFWLPRSQIEIEPNGKSFIVTMPEWLAIEKGLL